MTTPARISQADMDRATKAVAAARISFARIVMDLEKRRIEIIIGESAKASTHEEWTDDDF